MGTVTAPRLYWDGDPIAGPLTLINDRLAATWVSSMRSDDLHMPVVPLYHELTIERSFGEKAAKVQIELREHQHRGLHNTLRSVGLFNPEFKLPHAYGGRWPWSMRRSPVLLPLNVHFSCHMVKPWQCFCLFIDAELDWERCRQLLDGLHHYGLLEKSYYEMGLEQQMMMSPNPFLRHQLIPA